MNTVDFIKQEEGFRSEPYLDSLGYPTIGYGQLLSKRLGTLNAFSGLTVTEEEASGFLLEGVNQCEDDIRVLLSRPGLGEARQTVLVSMCYQLGLEGLIRFDKFIDAVVAQNWANAAKEMLDSKWAKQTPARAKRQAAMMLYGDYL